MIQQIAKNILQILYFSYIFKRRKKHPKCLANDTFSRIDLCFSSKRQRCWLQKWMWTSAWISRSRGSEFSTKFYQTVFSNFWSLCVHSLTRNESKANSQNTTFQSTSQIVYLHIVASHRISMNVTHHLQHILFVACKHNSHREWDRLCFSLYIARKYWRKLSQ